MLNFAGGGLPAILGKHPRGGLEAELRSGVLTADRLGPCNHTGPPGPGTLGPRPASRDTK